MPSNPLLLRELTGEIEIHSIEGVKNCFERGANPNDYHEGKTMLNMLISMYTRGPKFSKLIKLFLEYGAEYDDKVLMAVLLDDADALDEYLNDEPSLISKQVSLDCAYIFLEEVSLMHVCAEYNHVNCAKVLLDHGADVNVISGVDEYGFGGFTPIFQTVNQNKNSSKDMMYFLLDNGADLEYTVKGFYWGKTYPWETFVPAVNPISYAMMGLLRQFHRSEEVIAEVVSTLMKYKDGTNFRLPNIPNKYANA